jgi:hypothetical protein
VVNDIEADFHTHTSACKYTHICHTPLHIDGHQVRDLSVAPPVPWCCYTVVTLLLHCCYTVVTLLLHCCYTDVTLLFHSC